MARPRASVLVQVESVQTLDWVIVSKPTAGPTGLETPPLMATKIPAPTPPPTPPPPPPPPPPATTVTTLVAEPVSPEVAIEFAAAPELATELADLLVFLRKLSDSPAALPQ